jgi:hypothetical protein
MPARKEIDKKHAVKLILAALARLASDADRRAVLNIFKELDE